MSSIGKTKATGVYHEWQTDSLAASTTANALVEGADASAADLSPTTRIGNYTQIVGKTIQVSGTLEAVDKAGRKSEKAYQLAKASAEIKRDIETIITANQGQAVGTSNSTARKMGSLLSYIKTNTSKNGTSVTGVDPTTIGVSTRTDGTFALSQKPSSKMLSLKCSFLAAHLQLCLLAQLSSKLYQALLVCQHSVIKCQQAVKQPS
jgi:hypothetical protein